jgi:hypothetical protein
MNISSLVGPKEERSQLTQLCDVPDVAHRNDERHRRRRGRRPRIVAGLA